MKSDTTSNNKDNLNIDITEQLEKLVKEKLGMTLSEIAEHWEARKSGAEMGTCFKSACDDCEDDDPYCPYLIFRKIGGKVESRLEP